MKKISYIVFFVFFVFAQAKAQEPTIGLLEIDYDQISEGYILFCPWISSEYYLINNCGQKINTWKTEEEFDLKMAYLDEEGFLWVLNSHILSKYDWESDKIWEFNSMDFGLTAHHDFHIMPNGNFIVIASEVFGPEEVSQVGFNELDIGFVAIDGLYEYKHIQEDSFELIWKWNFKDHLVQEANDTLDNYGPVHASPRKLNINFADPPEYFDWLHCNGLDYNETLDQLIISSRNTSEIYIIDHSTTIEEAASSVGGNQDFGGDFLWRWGFQNLKQQHDPNWIPEGQPNEGLISVFNNIDGTEDFPYSSIKIIDPPLDAQGKYLLDTLNQFLPAEASKIISGEEHGIFSPFMSGAHSQVNGNYIICSGRFGDFFELTEEGEMVWKYHNPIFETPLPQFQPAQAAFTFNIRKYPTNFAGFQGKDLSPDGLVENVNPLSEECILLTEVTEPNEVTIDLYPNPTNNKVYFQSGTPIDAVQIFALSGKRLTKVINPGSSLDINLKNGSYILQLEVEGNLVNKLITVIQ